MFLGGNQSEWRVLFSFPGGEGGEGEEAAPEGQPQEEPEEEEEITSPIFVQNGEIRGKFEIYITRPVRQGNGGSSQCV